jgi:hypothetical protein
MRISKHPARIEAEKNNDKHFDGIVCSFCESTKRYTSNGGCVKCYISYTKNREKDKIEKDQIRKEFKQELINAIEDDLHKSGNEDLVDMKYAMAALSRSSDVILKFIRSEKLSATRVVNRYYFKRLDLLNYLKNNDYKIIKPSIRVTAAKTNARIYIGSVCETCGKTERFVTSGGCQHCANERGLNKLNDIHTMAKYKTTEKRRESDTKNKNRLLNTQMMRNYGITLEEYNQMLADQGGVCDICKNIDNLTSAYRLGIDHDHKSDGTDKIKVRGLLCSRCNAGIGHFRENIEIMESAITYLKKHNE